ncbi:hypothetical protein [Micromonospora sp. RTP1Z1]|uniref:hypothetical protein n=1 Tax=Micromonospora sp. RTP1Z1 TaxID=2994043 RepID=UPI0029C82EA9|nr:hypothetical protein [Micromonospora sp. RTP1Z1]
MRFSRLLLLVSAVTGVVSVLAALFSMGQASLRYGLVMLLSVVAYLVVAGPRRPPGLGPSEILLA